MRTNEKRVLARRCKKMFPGLRDRTLISWSERELFEPARKSTGRGSTRGYSYTNLVEISIVRELLGYGVPFWQVKDVMQSTDMKEVLNEQQWNSVFLISRGRAAGVNSEISTLYAKYVWIDTCLDKIRNDANDSMIEGLPIKTSWIILNIAAHRHYVEMMAKKA